MRGERRQRSTSFGPLRKGGALIRSHAACRLDRLRLVVPHAERANTASFLEEVITYIQGLQKRIAELEAGGTGASRSAPGAPAVVSAAGVGVHTVRMPLQGCVGGCSGPRL